MTLRRLPVTCPVHPRNGRSKDHDSICICAGGIVRKLDIFTSLFVSKGRKSKKLPYSADSMPATIEYASEAPARIDGASTYARLSKHMLLPNQRPDYLRLILTSRVYDIVKETPLVRATALSARLGNDIWLKREDLHHVFSFKIRGAYNFMASLSEDERWKGVITCSAGEHVQYLTL
jgi:hypothetical protein